MTYSHGLVWFHWAFVLGSGRLVGHTCDNGGGVINNTKSSRCSRCCASRSSNLIYLLRKTTIRLDGKIQRSVYTDVQGYRRNRFAVNTSMESLDVLNLRANECSFLEIVLADVRHYIKNIVSENEKLVYV